MKFLKNAKYYFMALLALCLVACGDDDDKKGGNGLDDTGDYTDSPLTPDQNKAQLENIGKEFVAKVNAEDHKAVTASLDELYTALDGSNFEDFLPDYLQDEEDYPVNPNLPALLSQVIEHNDANAMMDMATQTFDDEYRISDFQGIYTYNATTREWTQTTAQNQVEFRYGNSVLTVACKDIKEYTKVDQTLIEVPATTTVTLTVDGKTVLGMETKIALSQDMYSVDIESTLTLTGNYVWAFTASAKSDKAATTFKMIVKDEELINGIAELNGTQMTDPDYIDKNEEDVFNTGKVDCQIMNIRLTGEGDIKAIIKGEDKIGEEYPWDTDYDEAKDKKNAEALNDLYNSYLKVQGFYVAEKQKFADVKSGLYSEEVETWHWNDVKQDYDHITVKDWDVQPILVFTDKSEMEFDSFFTETRFSSLINSVETLVNQYRKMFGEAPVKW